jgi:hypothetical protein
MKGRDYVNPHEPQIPGWYLLALFPLALLVAWWLIIP